MCNLAAHCVLEQLKQETVNVAILNNGIAQGDIRQGLLTYGEFCAVFPVNAYMFGIELNGVSLVAVLEDALDAAVNGDEEAHPCCAGIRYSVDMTAVRGKRVTNMETRVGTGDFEWIEFDMNQIYLVATTRSLLQGRHGHKTFNSIEDDVLDLNESFYDSFARCAAANCPFSAVLSDHERRQLAPSTP